MSKDIKLPDAYHGAQLERAPVISVSGDAVTLRRGARVDLDRRPGQGPDVLNVPGVGGRACATSAGATRPSMPGPRPPFRGLVNAYRPTQDPLQGDQAEIMFACNQSGFGNITSPRWPGRRGPAQGRVEVADRSLTIADPAYLAPPLLAPGLSGDQASCRPSDVDFARPFRPRHAAAPALLLPARAADEARLVLPDRRRRAVPGDERAARSSSWASWCALWAAVFGLVVYRHSEAPGAPLHARGERADLRPARRT